VKLVVFGLSITSSWGNGHATLWRGLCAALARLGHRVVFFEKDTPYYAAHRDLATLAGYELRLYQSWPEIAPRAKIELADADVALVTSYCPDGARASELALASHAAARVYYDLDTPVTIAKLRAGEPVPYLPDEGLGGFDLVLSSAGGRALHALRERAGAKRVAPLYGAVDAAAHHPAPKMRAYEADLSYLGTYSKDRQPTLERLFVDVAQRLPDLRFVLAGPLYPADFPWTANMSYFPHVAPPSHPSFYCSSRATLNVTRAPMAEAGYCPSGRIFEAAACGVPIISDAWPGVERFFEPGREIAVAYEAEEVASLLERPPRELADMAVRARSRVLAEHTADHRARELCELVQQAPSRRPHA
jgi:spore maturation protein CgeB